ncbi:hypothetical protein HY357_03655 [Candidatus Roizmanbacteria bacterium]|nr:hypothetical protein [Candidatus Roizmanbacteria bacterium]
MYQPAMHSNSKIVVKITYILVCILLISISFGAMSIFLPFTFVDNDQSKLICDKNAASFDIGPNYIYTLEDRLDAFNDEKARKLCEYSIIRDYGNFYQTPQNINYQFKPVYAKDSSWGDALLIGLATFFFGVLIIEGLQKIFVKQIHLTGQYRLGIVYGFILLGGAIVFLIFLRKPAKSLFCQRQIARKVVNFRNSAFQGGVIPIPEEDKHINSLTKTLYETCLKSR